MLDAFSRLSTHDALGAGAAFLTISILYCMLVARRAGPGSQRVAVAAVSPSPRLTSPASSPRRHISSSLPYRSTLTSTMLQGALRKHEQQTAQKATTQNVFARHASSASSTDSGTANPGYRNPLKPTPASTLNGNGSSQFRFGSAGVKRTSSGLAKALDTGSFEASTPKAGTGNHAALCSDLFDENDFDSDIELEIEQPPAKVAKSSVTDPSLPKQFTPTAVIKPVVYPTLPRQQSIQCAMMGTAELTNAVSATPSSNRNATAIPWSSSPTEHFAPARPNIKQFSYHAPEVARGANESVAPVVQKAKRRQLPWDPKRDAVEQAVPTYPSSNVFNTAHSSTATPAAKKRGYSLWNTTASAIKEQQKKHREEGKKASVKAYEATAEDLVKAKTARSRPARVFLSDEQQHVLDLVCEKKKSVFFTGSAGTGKSVLMREIIATLQRKHQREPDRVAVTASTGLAACNVGGVTLHSFSGIGLGKEDVPELVRKIKRNQKAKHRWLRTKVLVIDEVSMVDGELFDKLEQIARQLRNNGRPFGGIQLVITGDFFQLPPVPDSGKVAKFAFDAATWNTTIEHTIGLHHVFRQKDPIFAGMLNEMREGRLSEASIKAFRNLHRELRFEDAIDATELFPTRNEVDRANVSRLSMLQGKEVMYEAKDGGTIVDKAQRDKLLSNCMAPDRLTLKKGAQVMLIKNVDESLVNGSLGRVIGFMSEARFDQYHQNEDGLPDVSIPEATDLGQALEERVKSRIQGITTAKEYPVVRFTIADGSTRDLLCQPEPWKVELPNGEVQASRSQVPLILAWALSIHKAQGQTLDRVKVDLGKVFEKGQAYVALSRATSMAGLQVMRFDPKKVNAHERVRTFYQNLGRVELENSTMAD